MCGESFTKSLYETHSVLSVYVISSLEFGRM